MEYLEKIDIIRERTGVSYREAREVLEEAGGDVIDALARLEERAGTWQERIQVHGSELVEKVKDLIHEGNVTRVRVRQGEKILFEIPVTVGAVGALLLPTIAALGVVAAMVTRCTIEVERQVDPCDPFAGDDDPIM
ncbi:MAG TPA: DUF4342 domain-containing protein [Firmicutes bacterium]|jgi:acetoin utilization deacetylase AcuC-like enzyme|nr:DUF4342 domain-containing protein [Bacillota bacterium]